MLFLVLVGFALNLIIGLWIRSSVDAAAHDAAMMVASQPPSLQVEQAAIMHARTMLGSYANKVHFAFEHDADSPQVILHVQTPGYGVMPRMIGEYSLVPGLDRRIVIHREFTS